MTLTIWQTRFEDMMGVGRLCSVTLCTFKYSSCSSSNKYCHERAHGQDYIDSITKCIFTFKLRYITPSQQSLHFSCTLTTSSLYTMADGSNYDYLFKVSFWGQWRRWYWPGHRLSSLVIPVLANRTLSCIFKCVNNILIFNHVTASNCACYG